MYLLHTRIGHSGMNHRTLLTSLCISLEFLLSSVPVMIDWSTTCVSIERTIIAVIGVRFNKKKSISYAKSITVVIIDLNIAGA
jgi:hypothetical protein